MVHRSIHIRELRTCLHTPPPIMLPPSRHSHDTKKPGLYKKNRAYSGKTRGSTRSEVFVGPQIAPLPHRQLGQRRRQRHTCGATGAAADRQPSLGGRCGIDTQGGQQHHVAIALALQVQRRVRLQRRDRFALARPRQTTSVFLRLVGLMTIPPPGPDPEASRPHFRYLRSLLERVLERGYPFWHGRELSMGMSDDYLVAVEEGATMIRVGRAIFGER